MRNIQNYVAEKYRKSGWFSMFKKSDYHQVEDGIYEYKKEDKVLYVTSLSFEQEPEYEENEFADNISQYPLEDILDKFYCHITDFYEDLNVSDSRTCYLEFAAMDMDDVRKLRSIIGKHVYNADYEEDGRIYVRLVIEE